MGTTPQIAQAVKEFHQRVEATLDTPVEVILYGSHARGDATDDSDVDVVIILPQLDSRVQAQIADIAWEIGFDRGIVFSVIPVARTDLALLEVSPFFQAVQREGIRL